METPIPSGPVATADQPMQKLTIRCHPYAPLDLVELDGRLRARVNGLRLDAPRAIIRLSRLTQELPSSAAGIGWLLELEMPEGSPLLGRGRLARTLADLRMLGIQPTALAPVDPSSGLGSPDPGAVK